MKTLSKSFKIKVIVAILTICSAFMLNTSIPTYAAGVSNTTKILHQHTATGSLHSGSPLSDDATYESSGRCYTAQHSERYPTGTSHGCWTGTGMYYSECPNGHPACAQGCGCHTAGCPYMCHCNGAAIHADYETRNYYSKSCPFDTTTVIQELTLSSDGKGKLNITVLREALVTSYKIYKGSTLLTTSSSYQTTSPGTYTAEITTIDSQTSQKRTGSVSITTTEEEYLKATLSANIETTETSWTNEDVTLTVEANADVNYKWYRNGDEIFGAVKKNYVVDDFSNGDEFYCCVTRKDNSGVSLNTNKLYVYFDNEKPTLESTSIQTYTEESTLNELAHSGLSTGDIIHWASQNLLVQAGAYKDSGSGIAFCDLYKGNKNEGGKLISHSSVPTSLMAPGKTFTALKAITESGTYYQYVIDKAGNELCFYYDIYIDKTIPSVNIESSTSSGSYTENEWTSEDITLVASDSVAHASGNKIQWYKNGNKIDDATDWTYTVTEECSSTDTYKAVVTTGAGLIGEKSFKIRLDKKVPSVTKVDYSSYVPAKNITATISTDYGTSGIKTYYAVNGDIKLSSTTNTINLTKDGEWHFFVESNSGLTSEQYDGNYVCLDNVNPSDINVVFVDGNENIYTNTKKIKITAKDNCGISDLCLLKNEIEIECNSFFGGSKDVALWKTSVESEEYEISENGTYAIKVTDIAGNTTTQTFEITTCDNEVPIATGSEVSKSETLCIYKLTLSDNAKLSKYTIALNGSLFDEVPVTGKQITENINLTDNGMYTVNVYDEAGNKSEELSFLVSCIIKNYTLDEQVTLFHMHGGTPDSTSANGCYTTAYSTTESYSYREGTGNYYCGGCSWDSEKNDWVQGWCPNCGRWESSWCACCEDTRVVTGTKTVTRYKCERTNEITGTMVLNKTTDGEYVLTINSELSHAEVMSYKWEGKDVTTGDYPSTHVMGYPSDINTVTSNSIVVPDFGYYTCEVVLKDTYSGSTFKERFYYTVEDFDLTPPEVAVVAHNKTPKFDYTKDENIFTEVYDYNENVKVDSTVREELGYRYIELHLTDNMWLDTIECISKPSDSTISFDKTQLNKGMEDTVIMKVNKNGVYTLLLKDCMLNEYEFKVVVNSIDIENPVIGDLIFDINTWTTKDLELIIAATDNFEITGYYVSRYDDENFERCVPENTFTITENGIYYVYARDAIGNMSSMEMNVSWIDREGPKLDEPDEHGNSNIYVTVNGRSYTAKATDAILKFDLSSEKDAQFATINVKVKDNVEKAVKRERE